MKKTVKILLLVFVLLFVACSDTSQNGENDTDDTQEITSQEMQVLEPIVGDTVAEIVTSEGSIKVKLFTDIAPLATENFISLANEGYYNGVIFHRVIEDFMIQSGDPTGTGAGGESIFKVDFEDEFSDLLHHYTGALSMANRGENTNSSQFFIVATQSDISNSEVSAMEKAGYRQEVIDTYAQTGGTSFLDYKHSVFGQVYEGLDIVFDISEVDTDSSDKPEEEIIIEEIIISQVQ